MKRFLLTAIFFLSTAAASGQRPPLTRALADALYAKLAGGSVIAGTTTLTNLTVTGTCTGCASGAVPTTRLISTTAPLGGGGDLSADRTLTCTTCATSANNLSFFSATTSAQLASVLSDETGTGLTVFNNAPTLIGPALGTPASGVMTNVTGTAAGLTAGNVTTNANLTGPITSVGNATSIAAQTGTGTTFAMSVGPTFTGVPAAPTAAVDTNTTQIATTAMVLAQAASANPVMDGSVAVGTSTRYARADHVHASDTSRAPTAAPTFTGTAAFSAITASSTITPSSTAGIVGTTTNNNANAGSFGEYVSAQVTSGSAVALTNTVSANVTSVSLTAGDWDCSGDVFYALGATTNVVYEIQSISTTSATNAGQGSYTTVMYPASYIPGNTTPTILLTPTVRELLSGTTTVYLVATSSFSTSTASVYGDLRCRRVR